MTGYRLVVAVVLAVLVVSPDMAEAVNRVAKFKRRGKSRTSVIRCCCNNGAAVNLSGYGSSLDEGAAKYEDFKQKCKDSADPFKGIYLPVNVNCATTCAPTIMPAKITLTIAVVEQWYQLVTGHVPAYRGIGGVKRNGLIGTLAANTNAGVPASIADLANIAQAIVGAQPFTDGNHRIGLAVLYLGAVHCLHLRLVVPVYLAYGAIDFHYSHTMTNGAGQNTLRNQVAAAQTTALCCVAIVVTSAADEFVVDAQALPALLNTICTTDTKPGMKKNFMDVHNNKCSHASAW